MHQDEAALVEIQQELARAWPGRDRPTRRVFGDAAVVTGRTRGVGEFEGADYDVTMRFTDVFVRRAGGWQAVASHASLVQE